MYRIYCTLVLFIGILDGLKAQICQGSLGDPIINITFGSGQNPGPPLPAATTNYQYISDDCPKDGYYAVRNFTYNCHDNTWFQVKDHTGNTDGYFMIVNASFQPGDFYLDTVRGLCGSSTYEFASWLINVKRPVLCWGASQIINPNITFKIEKLDGSVLQTYSTGDIAATDSLGWKQYGFYFTTPAGVNDVVVRMTNNAPGGCGNDIGLDDITFRACGPQVNASIAGRTGTIDTLCGGTAQSYTFNGQVSAGYANPTYQWQEKVNEGGWSNINGAVGQNHATNFSAAQTPGNYSYRLLVAESGNINSANCRVASSPVTIVVTEKPLMNVFNSSPVCEGGICNLTATGNTITWSGPGNYAASGSSISISNIQAAQAGKYYATSTIGSCSWMDSTVININTKPTVTATADSSVICEGNKTGLTANGGASYVWEPANSLSDASSANPVADPTLTTTYIVTAIDGKNCSDTASVTIHVLRKPKANAGADSYIAEGSSAQLNGTVVGDSISYYWTPDYKILNDQSLNPVVSPPTDTSYILHVVSNAGCGIAEDMVRVIIFKKIEVPNAFSPNGDGINDRWNIPALNSYLTAEVFVYDRYGREIYRGNNFRSWDGTNRGKELPVATYYYVIDLKNNLPKLSGWVLLAK
jgi:gliding motility-associated-like protein